MDKDKYIGRLLDNRYEILEVIGTGGMAVVYKARCHRLNRLVAVKILKDDNLEDEDFRRRFHAESQAVAMLSHPNIVSVYDVSTSVMADYIVMELIEGITLKQYMEKKGILNWKETLHFAMQIAKALEHAHSKGIVHRDIKPHNVMVLKNGSVKVMDFGIARLISRGNTLTKEALGSVHYISPEQAKGGRVDDRSDIYSLGIVMYEMMAGRPPYDGESPVAVAIQHINGGAALPSVLNPNIPGGLEQIIMKAMAHNVSDRYASVTRMLADMDAFRKDPTLLFDYTGLPLDAAIRVQKPQLVLQPPTTTAEKVALRQSPRRSPQGQPPGSGSKTVQGKNSQNGVKSVQGGNTPNRNNKPVPSVEARHKDTLYRQEALRRRQQEERRSRIATIAIIVCSLVAVIAIGIFMAILLGGGFTPDEKLVEVPKLTGEVFAELPEYPGLTIKKEELYDENVEAGRIISQKPDAGKMVVEGSYVVVNVSLGPVPRVVTMGNLENRSKDWATSFMQSQELDLDIEIKVEYNDEVAKGYVIRTSPKQGTVLKKGQKVTLWISEGKKPQIAAMPNVVGEEITMAENVLDLQDLDLEIVIEELYHFTVKEGYVIETIPTRGEKLKTGDTVTLYVSKGIEKKIMPDLVGMDVTAAKDMLVLLGFKEPTINYVYDDIPKDTVLNQSLEKELEYEIIVDIVLEVSKGPQMPVTKDVVIDLKGFAEFSDCYVTVSRNGNVVHFETVAMGTTTLTIPEQTGLGIVTYTVEINNGQSTWDVMEEFVEPEVEPDVEPNPGEEEPPANG